MTESRSVVIALGSLCAKKRAEVISITAFLLSKYVEFMERNKSERTGHAAQKIGDLQTAITVKA